MAAVTGEEKRPAQLHVMHSWGGGLERWVRDYCRSERSRQNWILKSLGRPGTPGEAIALYRDIDDCEPLRRWELAPPIHATAVTHLGYCYAIEAAIVEFDIRAILVSSLIGHSLDILNTGLETLVICHDYYPFCPAINIYFNRVCQRCDSSDLHQCFQENKYHRFLTDITATSWPPIREGFRQLVLRNQIPLAIPSHSVRQHLIELEPELAAATFFPIAHGVDWDVEKIIPRDRASKQRKLRILVLGSLALQKGFDLLCEICPQIADCAEVYLLGYGDEGSAFPHFPHVFRIAKTYRREELASRIAAIDPDLGLLLSVWPETFSYTLSELMILGIPTLATNLGSFSERIEEGKTGFLAPPEGQAIAQKIRDLSQQHSRLKTVRDSLQNRTHKSLAVMVEDYRRVASLAQPPQIRLSRELNLVKMVELEYERVLGDLEQIEELKQTIAAMESSKFWKLRRAWFKLKVKARNILLVLMQRT